MAFSHGDDLKKKGAVMAEKFMDKSGTEFTSSELSFIKKVAKVMNRPWQAVAARSNLTSVIMEAMERGNSAEEAANAIRMSHVASEIVKIAKDLVSK